MKRLLVSLLALNAGCYGYYPVSGATPSGREVELALTDSGSVVLARQVGQGVVAIAGRVAGDSSGALLLNMASTRTRDGNETGWRGERVAVPRALVATMGERRFSRGRTTLFGGALAVALVAIRQGFGGTGASSGGSGLPTTTGPR
jgi:hypothetical protein